MAGTHVLVPESGGTPDPLWNEVSKTITFDESAGTWDKNLFVLTGVIAVYFMFGRVTQNLGSNHTAAQLQLYDGTTTVQVSSAAGLNASSYFAGAHVLRIFAATSALFGFSANSAPIGCIVPTAAHKSQESALAANDAATTYLRYRFSTTNNPTTGAMEWTAYWYPLSPDGNLVAA